MSVINMSNYLLEYITALLFYSVIPENETAQGEAWSTQRPPALDGLHGTSSHLAVRVCSNYMASQVI